MKGFIKIVSIYFLRLLVRVFYIFPIKNNRIILSSYKGTQYACNPKYISEKMHEMYPDTFEIIWCLEHPYDYNLPHYIKKVKYNSIKRFYYEATSKISINNIGSFSYLPRRKGQEHVNTWHSGLDLECCGINEKENDYFTKKSIELSGKETSLFLSSNKVFSEYSVIEQFGYSGLIFNAGLPRSDVLINDNKKLLRMYTRKNLGIENDALVLMYAPTWRYGGTERMPLMNYNVLADALCEVTENKFYILNRSHHLTKIKSLDDNEHVVDVSNYPDIQALVECCDILVSDYSSVLWDGAVSNKILIQYAPDAKEFTKSRGLYVPTGKWGMPAAYAMNELCEMIKNLKKLKLNSYYENVLAYLGNYETGKASELFVYWAFDVCFGPENEIKYKNYLNMVKNDSDSHLIDDMNKKDFITIKSL